MSNFPIVKVGDFVPNRTIAVYYSGTDTLQEGMALCYDISNTTSDREASYVTKPTLANANHFAGVVAGGQTFIAAAGGSSTVGPYMVQIVPVDNGFSNGVKFYTDENLAIGDLLGVIPGEYFLGKCTVGRPIGIVTHAALTNATDATTVLGTCKLGWVSSMLSDADIGSKLVRYFNHFVGTATSATADATDFAATLNSGTITLADDLTLEPSSGAIVAMNLSGAGILKVSSTSTTETSAQLNGEPFSIAPGQSIFFRARVAVGSITTQSAFFGLSATDTSPAVSLNNDHIGFKILVASPGLVTFTYNNSGGTAVTKSTAITLVNSTFVEFAFLVRMKTATSVKIHMFANGTEVTGVTETAATVPYDESLTLGFGCFDSTSAQSMYIDRVEVANYFSVG